MLDATWEGEPDLDQRYLFGSSRYNPIKALGPMGTQPRPEAPVSPQSNRFLTHPRGFRGLLRIQIIFRADQNICNGNT